MFTTGHPSIEETELALSRRRGLFACSPSKNPVIGDVVNKNKIGVLASCALLAVTLAACGKSGSSSTGTSASSSSATISGAGSTFAAPVYQQWGSGISGLTVNYNPVGSGAGITSREGKTVDFGASDPPLKPAESAHLEKVGPVQQIPMFFGRSRPLQPAGRQEWSSSMAERRRIFLGKIKTWNQTAIAGPNPGVAAEHPIAVIHRYGLLLHELRLHGFLASVEPGTEEQGRRRQDRAVAHGTGAKATRASPAPCSRNDRLRRLCQQSERREKFTYASVKNKAGTMSNRRSPRPARQPKGSK